MSGRARRKSALGSLLLQRLSSGRARPAPRRPKRSGPRFTFFGSARIGSAEGGSQKSGSAPGNRDQRDPAETRTPALTQSPALPASDFLSSNDLARPEGKLRTSIEAFLLDQRSPHTRRSYGKDLKRFVQFLHGRLAGFGPERITRSLIVSYKEFLLAEGLEHTTVDRHLSTLRSFFRWLVDDGAIEKNPAEGVRFLKPRRLSRTIGFSDDEVQRILKVPDLHTRTGSLHYAMLMVLFYCGLRRSELCDLRMANLGEERGARVFRLRGKGNAERIVVIVPAVWNALKHYFLITARDPRAEVPVFAPVRNNRTGVKEKPLDPSQVFYVVTRYAKLAGISNRVSPHSCRATAISNARDHHVPDRAIQEFAGWTSPDMITRYDKRKTSVEDSAARAIAYGAEDRAPAPPAAAPREAEKPSDGPSPEKFLASLPPLD